MCLTSLTKSRRKATFLTEALHVFCTAEAKAAYGQLLIAYFGSVNLGLFLKPSLLQALQVLTVAHSISSWLEKRLEQSLPTASRLCWYCFIPFDLSPGNMLCTHLLF